jgi:hypothetical protein
MWALHVSLLFSHALDVPMGRPGVTRSAQLGPRPFSFFLEIVLNTAIFEFE